jgi:hypothetical protein
VDERAKLLSISDFTGPAYGTEDFCLFLYSLVRLQAPKVMVELGTGFGTSALWMALGAKQNGSGHVWTIDDGGLFRRHAQVVSMLLEHLKKKLEIELPPSADEHEYLGALAEALKLTSFLTFIRSKMDVAEQGHFDRYAFSGKPIDLLFSDFRHGATDILSILGHFLPRMADASSIFIDSASTAWPSYLVLEQVVSLLNRGQAPRELQRQSACDLSELMRNRRIVLIHLTEQKNRPQNSTAWLKIEPIDVVPHPRTYMRGMQGE